jgi:vacuolar-type H+-ATPase subunit I/STV1
MPAKMPDATPHKVGGARPGAGRPPSSTVRIFATVKRETAEKLERIAKEKGFERRPSSTKPFYGGAIDALAESVETKEPEYVKLVKALAAIRSA